MTVLALLLGSLAAGLGTRLAAVAFVAAAVSSAIDGGPFAPVVTWTAALAAGLVLLDPGSVRRFGLPALGAAAVLGAALSRNGAVVLGLWVVGTAAAAAGITLQPRRRREADPSRPLRWALSLCALDLLVAIAVVSAATRGFEGWPNTLDATGRLLLLLAALGRIPLAAGPSGTTTAPGLLVVRTQALVLATLAIGTGGPGIAEAAIFAGAAVFAIAVLSGRPERLDAAQEIGLYAMALAGASLSWAPRGWTWGVLAAGTLIHQLRVMVGRGTAGRWAFSLLSSPGIGLVFLPAIVAVVEGSLIARGPLAAAAGLGLFAGVAGRIRRVSPRARRATRSGPAPFVEGVRGWVVVAAAGVAALWAGAVSLPRPPAGSPVGWPPHWAPVVVIACAGLAAFTGGVVPPRRRAVTADPVAPSAVLHLLEGIRVPASKLAIWTILGVVALAAVGLWVVGLTRGFL